MRQLYGNVISKQRSENRTRFFHKDDIQILKRLGKDENLIICKPDKGKGAVIMNKSNYLKKVKEVLEKDNTFEKVNVDDPLKHTILLEDRHNRNLRKWQSKGIITEKEYKEVYATGTRPGILYGLPKVHKENIPIRPGMSARKIPLYAFSKFLIQFIENFTFNEYTLKNSMQLIDDLKNIQVNSDNYMVSYDIDSLYTNEPVEETIIIILEQINDENMINFTKEEEENHKLPFLDIMLEREQSTINTAVFRKKTYTGVGLHFTSFTFHRFKLNAFSTFLYRSNSNYEIHSTMCYLY
ncbi:uncharacterized protein [Palaemon carinicauda]|uniref:uncharacterized protein n=1 Tax=Palaemon carinicauda TaxID=392227 RepID=UPI0035B60581